MTETPPRRPPQASPRSRKKPAALPPAPDQACPSPVEALPDHRPEARWASTLGAPAEDGASADAVVADGGMPEQPKSKRIHKPVTEEQRQRYNAVRRQRWAETRHLRQRPHRYTLRQSKLIEAYLRLGAIIPAALEAGYTRSSGRGCAGMFLRRPDVAALIAARRQEMRQRSEVTMERVIGELAKLAFADPRDLFTADGKLKPLHDLDDASAASISALEVLAVAGGRRAPAGGTRGARSKAVPSDVAGTADDAAADSGSGDTGSSGDVVLELRKIKRWDKTKALELLGRYLGLFKDRLELGVSEDLAAAIEAARKRSRALAAPEAAQVVEGEVIEVEAGEVVDVAPEDTVD